MIIPSYVFPLAVFDLALVRVIGLRPFVRSRDPCGQRDHEPVRQGHEVGLIPPDQPDELRRLPRPDRPRDCRGLDRRDEGRHIGLGQSPRGLGIGREAQGVGEVLEQMQAHAIGELRLLGGESLSADDQHGAAIEERREGDQPRLAPVLRPVERQDGMGEMALEDLGHPTLALAQDAREEVLTIRARNSGAGA